MTDKIHTLWTNLNNASELLAQIDFAKLRVLLAENGVGSGLLTVPDAQEPFECETCSGVGTIDETLGGEYFSNPKAKCPDCDGHGEIYATPPTQALATPAQEWSDTDILTLLDKFMDEEDDETFRTCIVRFARALLNGKNPT